MRKTIIIAALALALGPCAAHAAGPDWSITCDHTATSTHCEGGSVSDAPVGANARIIKVPVVDRGPEERAAWRTYCRPREVVDELGVTHLLYAHAGCEFGRTH